MFASPLGRNNPDLSGRGTGHTWARPRHSPPELSRCVPAGNRKVQAGLRPQAHCLCGSGMGQTAGTSECARAHSHSPSRHLSPHLFSKVLLDKEQQGARCQEFRANRLSLAGSPDKETGAPVSTDSTCAGLSSPGAPRVDGLCPSAGQEESPLPT